MIIDKKAIETALREIPFTIHMADGRSYRVTDKARLVSGPSHIVFVDEIFVPHMIPYLTITGINYETEKQRPRRPRKS
jgi:hypothetical protein